MVQFDGAGWDFRIWCALYGERVAEDMWSVAAQAYAMGYEAAKSDHGVVTDELKAEADEAATLQFPVKP